MSLGVGLLVLALVLYATRRLIAREVLTGWLRAHGVVAAAEVRSFGPGGFRGRLVVGDPNAPVNDPAWLRGAPTVLVNARWVPPTRSPGTAKARLWSGSANPFTEGPHLGTVDGEIAYAVLDTRRLQAISPATLDDCLGDWTQSLPANMW